MASAKPATAPDASRVGVPATAKTVPDVPSEIATSPSCSPSPSGGAHVVAGAGTDDRVAERARDRPGSSTVGATARSSPTRLRTSSA